jgi:hypothetical protein
MFGNKLINTNAGGGCTNTVDLYNPFPDGGGVALYQLNGNATDVSGNYDGTATNVTYGTGVFGQAGVFNGSSSGVNLPSSLNTSVIDATGAFSISMWINANDISTIQYLFCSNTVNNVEIGINSNSQGVGKIVWTIYNTSYSYLISTTTITTNTWYNIIVTYNNGLSELFINGASQGTITKTLLESSIEPTLGYRNTGGPVRFNGSIDQVRFFSRALRPYEVEALYTEEYCTPTIVPSEHFNTVLYTGNSSSQSITGVGFQPDLVWIKSKNISGANHNIYDSVRGAGKTLFSNANLQEYTTSEMTGFSSDGFDFSGTAFDSNNVGNDLVAWNFKAGGSAVTNTDGTITSQVSANTEAGFSIVSFVGNGSTSANVGHGLNNTPKIVIVKDRSAADDWQVKYVSDNYYLRLNNTNAADTSYPNYNATSTVINLGYTWNNDSGNNHIAYCFAEVEGFSNFGSYVGTGASGNTIVTGFEPAFVMVKRTDGTGVWVMLDNKRNLTNPRNSSLYANTSAQEDTGSTSGFYPMNFYENGFEPIQNTGDYNASGGLYIYMAFAADPTTIEPSLEDSFNTVLYTGNSGTPQTVTGMGFQPDMVWQKQRTGAAAHRIVDSIRGSGNYLYPNLTNANDGYNADYMRLASDGVYLPGADSNYATNNYVVWGWKAAEIPAINSNGSIPSVVSANPAAGFSIVSYTGNGANGDTVGHGLSAVPNVVIWKNRSDARNWVVWHSGLTSIDYSLILNSTSAEVLDSRTNRPFGQPTDSVLVLGEDNETNFSPNKFIAYCFAEVAGFSKFGSYTGTGASGNTVTVGFEPAFVMIKRTDAAGGSWGMYDNKRGVGEPSKVLYANLSAAEYADNFHDINFVGNTFVLLDNSNNTNFSGATYIYMAFANQF